MATTLEIIKALNQAAADAYDGGLELGLKKEFGDPILDSRVMDGFGVKIAGNKLTVTYNSQISAEEIAGIEADVDAMIQKIVNFLKTQYKTKGLGSLSLAAVGEVSARVESVSMSPSDHRVVAHKTFIIKNMKLNEDFLRDMMAKGLKEARDEKFDKTIKDTLFTNSWLRKKG